MTREGRQKELVPTRTMSRAAVWDLAGAEGFQSPRSCHPGGAHDIATQVASARSAFETRRAKLFFPRCLPRDCREFQWPMHLLSRGARGMSCLRTTAQAARLSHAERGRFFLLELQRNARPLPSRRAQPKLLASLARSASDFFPNYTQTPVPCSRAERERLLRIAAPRTLLSRGARAISAKYSHIWSLLWRGARAIPPP